MINRQKLALLALLAANCAEAFTFISPRNTVSNNLSNKLSYKSFQTSYTTLLKAGGDDAEKDMQFFDAEQAIKDQEDAERADARGNGSEQENADFDAKKDSMAEMKARIQARAADMNIEKSVATAEAIKRATARAQAGEAATTSTVDLSKFSDDLMENPEDELSKEQQEEIDKVGFMPFWEQAVDEFKNTKFPTLGATIKQAGLMAVIFVITATVILKTDEFLRIQYTDWGFIPKSGEILDYSDLALPEGFTDQMTDVDLANM